MIYIHLPPYHKRNETLTVHERRKPPNNLRLCVPHLLFPPRRRVPTQPPRDRPDPHHDPDSSNIRDDVPPALGLLRQRAGLAGAGSRVGGEESVGLVGGRVGEEAFGEAGPEAAVVEDLGEGEGGE